jgi:hypothetical protein
MPLFECKVSHTVLAEDLQTKRITEIVYIEAMDEREAKQKAGHPRNWPRSAGTLGKGDTSSSFLITVGECRRVHDHKAKKRSGRSSLRSHLPSSIRPHA